jgi:hypothetical protein
MNGKILSKKENSNMYMTSSDLAGIILGGILGIAGISISITVIYTKYKLRIENIKAQVQIKSEEIRAKNQLEIEKLYGSHTDNTKSTINTEIDSIDNGEYMERRRTRA